MQTGKDDDLTRIIHQAYTGRIQHSKKLEDENGDDRMASGFNTDNSSIESDKIIFTNPDDRNAKHIFDENTSSKNSDFTADLINGARTDSFISEKVNNKETVLTNFNQKPPETIEFETKYDNKKTSNKPVTYSYPVHDKNINKMTSKIIESLKIREQNQKDMMAFCWLWDFAGQKDFYATHQVFLSKCAVYLLVTDSLKFSTAEKPGANFDDSARTFFLQLIDTSSILSLLWFIISIIFFMDKFCANTEYFLRTNSYDEIVTNELKL